MREGRTRSAKHLRRVAKPSSFFSPLWNALLFVSREGSALGKKRVEGRRSGEERRRKDGRKGEERRVPSVTSVRSITVTVSQAVVTGPAAGELQAAVAKKEGKGGRGGALSEKEGARVSMSAGQFGVDGLVCCGALKRQREDQIYQIQTARQTDRRVTLCCSHVSFHLSGHPAHLYLFCTSSRKTGRERRMPREGKFKKPFCRGGVYLCASTFSVFLSPVSSRMVQSV